MIYKCYVGDSNEHVKRLMRQIFEPHDVFMTIRCYNKFKKEKPECIKKEDKLNFFIFEGVHYHVIRMKGV